MTLLGLLRHAHAGNPERWTGIDSERPLTDKGRGQAERLGRRLRQLGDQADAVITSPMVRALQTAELVADALGVPVTVDPRLGEPLDLDVVDTILEGAGNPERPILVGHDPDFSDVVAALLGTGPGTVPMRKATYARIEVDRPLAYGRGTLVMLLPPDNG